MTLTEQEIKQIERDAFDLCPDKDDFFDRAMRAGYTLACIKYVPQLRAERERAGKLLEALEWYADSRNYLAATNHPNDGINTDTLLATAYAFKRIENKARTAIKNHKNNQ